MLPYNPEDKNSILTYAKQLEGKTLREVCDIELIKNNRTGKGHFGQILEEFYFFYKPNSDSEPDFPIARLELKSSPLKQSKKTQFRSKERLVMNIINYMEVVKQDFETSSFWKKNANILLIFYLHHLDDDILDYLIKLVDEWNFPSTDLEIIKKDWELIKQKIADGKAHELSEGDTFYLGACTKGANALTVRKQPFSDIPAKQRAYSLKQGYVNHIIASIANDTTGVYGKLIPSVEVAKKQTIEDIVIAKFKPYYGKTIEEIITSTGVELNTTAKSFYANLTKAILGIELDKEIEEFEKADIEVKTIRVAQNNSIKESISFPAFEFKKIYVENWNTSELKELVERKFLFIFFKNDSTNYFLEKIVFWNMPFKDRVEVRKVWLKTKKLIQEGRIFKEFAKDKSGNIRHSKKGNPIRLNNLPKISENFVCHVRPHSKDSNDTFPLPIEDKMLKEKKYSKQCFWLSSNYVRDEIYNK